MGTFQFTVKRYTPDMRGHHILALLSFLVLYVQSLELQDADPDQAELENLFNKIRVFDIPLQQNVKRMNRLTPRRGDPFAFGLGKRSYYWRDTEKRDPYAFGLGK